MIVLLRVSLQFEHSCKETEDKGTTSSRNFVIPTRVETGFQCVTTLEDFFYPYRAGHAYQSSQPFP